MSSSDQVILYSIGRRGTLRFEKGKDYAYDADGASYYPGGIQRGGEMYVPASVVAQFFGLQYSVTDVQLSYDGQEDRGDLAAAAAGLRPDGQGICQRRLLCHCQPLYGISPAEGGPRRDQRAGDPHRRGGGGQADLSLPHRRRGHGALLDVLDSRQAQAAFFCTPEFLEQQGDLLRRMAATGQTIAILADAKDPKRSVTEQLEAGNQALAAGDLRQDPAGPGGTRDRGGSPAARAAGYRCLEADLDRTDYALRTTSNAAPCSSGSPATGGM